MKELKRILPEFPRTMHLPYKPNMVEGDIVCKDTDTDMIFTEDGPVSVFVEEKIDGANCGMAFFKGNAVIRNRTHILNKGYVKDTPAKIQFRPAWGWFYENKKKFQYLEENFSEVSVYGEWVYALHGIRYDKLPDWFIAYDLYDYTTGNFIATPLARDLLTSAGFAVPPLLLSGQVENWQQLEAFCNEPSVFSSTDQREGIYLKVTDGKYVTSRYKMVRSDYVQGALWDVREITKNKLA